MSLNFLHLLHLLSYSVVSLIILQIAAPCLILYFLLFFVHLLHFLPDSVVSLICLPFKEDK